MFVGEDIIASLSGNQFMGPNFQTQKQGWPGFLVYWTISLSGQGKKHNNVILGPLEQTILQVVSMTWSLDGQ